MLGFATLEVTPQDGEAAAAFDDVLPVCAQIVLLSGVHETEHGDATYQRSFEHRDECPAHGGVC